MDKVVKHIYEYINNNNNNNNNIVVFDYFIHSLYTVINTQRECHTLKLIQFKIVVLMRRYSVKY